MITAFDRLARQHAEDMAAARAEIATLVEEWAATAAALQGLLDILDMTGVLDIDDDRHAPLIAHARETIAKPMRGDA